MWTSANQEGGRDSAAIKIGVYFCGSDYVCTNPAPFYRPHCSKTVSKEILLPLPVSQGTSCWPKGQVFTKVPKPEPKLSRVPWGPHRLEFSPELRNNGKRTGGRGSAMGEPSSGPTLQGSLFHPVLGLFTSEPVNLYDFLSSPENEEEWRWWLGGPLTTTGRGVHLECLLPGRLLINVGSFP